VQSIRITGISTTKTHNLRSTMSLNKEQQQLVTNLLVEAIAAERSPLGKPTSARMTRMSKLAQKLGMKDGWLERWVELMWSSKMG